MTQDNRQRETHEAYTTTDRYWSPETEAHYTGGDSLITAQRQGWQLTGQVYAQEKDLYGGRIQTIYYFELHLNLKKRWMPVISNPYILRLMKRRKLEATPYSPTYEIVVVSQV